MHHCSYHIYMIRNMYMWRRSQHENKALLAESSSERNWADMLGEFRHTNLLSQDLIEWLNESVNMHSVQQTDVSVEHSSSVLLFTSAYPDSKPAYWSKRKMVLELTFSTPGSQYSTSNFVEDSTAIYDFGTRHPFYTKPSVFSKTDQCCSVLFAASKL